MYLIFGLLGCVNANNDWSKSSWQEERSEESQSQSTYKDENPYKPKDVHVKGHYRKDGTYVKEHYRSHPKRHKK